MSSIKRAESVRRLSERTTLLESRNQELRTAAIEALELVEVVLGAETPYVVQHYLRQLKRPSMAVACVR